MAKVGKGSEFERMISKQLSEWASNGEDDSWYWRTSQSGGRATQRAKAGKKTAKGYGDIMCYDPRGDSITELCVIEIKRGYSGMNVLDVIDSKKKNIELLDFWRQVKRDMVVSEKQYGIVIFKRDYRDVCIMMPKKLHAKLCGYNRNMVCRSFITMNINGDYMIIIPFADFLSTFTIQHFNDIRDNDILKVHDNV